MNEDEIRKIVEASPLAQHADDIMSEARPAVKMTAFFMESGDVPAGASRMGGAPDLPPDTPWPQNQGRPLEFLAQINFAQAMHGHPLPGLPTDGSLALFHDFQAENDGVYDDPRRWRLMPFDDPPGSLVRMEQPGDPVGSFNLCELEFEPEICLPCDLTLRFSSKNNRQEAWEYFNDTLWEMEKCPFHRIGGHPMLIQSDPADYPGMEFLMQIDSDSEVGWDWVDAGRVYCWGRQAESVDRLREQIGFGKPSEWLYQRVFCGEEFY